VRERRGSYNGFCCRLYPFICWIIIKEGLGNFSGGRSPHWVNHVNMCLSYIVCLLCFLFLHLFYFISPRSCFSNREQIAQGPFTIIHACLHLMTSLIFQNIFKKMCSVLFQLSLISPLSRCWLCLHALRCSCIKRFTIFGHQAVVSGLWVLSFSL